MKVNVTGDLVHVIVENGTLQAMFAAMNAAPDLPGKRLFIDASDCELSDPTVHALLGSELARKFSRAKKIALLVSEDVLSYDSERAARRSHVDLRVFITEADSRRWLEN